MNRLSASLIAAATALSRGGFSPIRRRSGLVGGSGNHSAGATAATLLEEQARQKLRALRDAT
jgi:hypothetical protein